MLSEKLFSQNDNSRIETAYHKWRKVSYIIVVVMVIIDFGIAYLTSFRDAKLFWPVAIVSLLVGFWAFYTIFLKRIKAFKKDLQENMKLVGMVVVKAKREANKQKILDFESEELKPIAVDDKVYQSVIVGDTLEIETSKHAQFIFKLSKENVLLMEDK
jgi:hypothetical protein